MTKDKALQMCLEYIETDTHERKYVRHAIKEALTKQEQKLVGTVGDLFDEGVIWMRQLDRDLLVYTAPSQSKPAQQGSDK